MKPSIVNLILFIFLFSGLCFSEERQWDPTIHEKEVRPAPEWATRGIIYQINPCAFTSEGTLKAIEAKLPHIRSTGATIIYLCPVFTADDERIL